VRGRSGGSRFTPSDHWQRHLREALRLQIPDGASAILDPDLPIDAVLVVPNRCDRSGSASAGPWRLLIRSGLGRRSRPVAGVLTHGQLCQYTAIMPDPTGRKRAVRREERVSRTYRLPLSKLKAAQRALGAATATETIERALDLAVFQRELVDGTRAMLGVRITSPDLEP
jgi:hypothetical protein